MWIKWRETRLYSVECITSHSVDSYIAFLAYFSGGLLLFFTGDASETRPTDFSGARNATLW